MNCRNHVEVSEGVRPCSRCGFMFCRDCLVDIAGQPYCATCKNEQLLDVRSGVRGGVLDIAPIGRRIWAYLLDTLILYIVSIAIVTVTTIIASTSSNAAASVSCIGSLLPMLFFIAYDAILVAVRGQTLGKMALKIKVVRETGDNVTTGQAWGRALAKLIPFAQFVALFNDERKGVHDMLAHTRVVNWAG